MNSITDLKFLASKKNRKILLHLNHLYTTIIEGNLSEIENIPENEIFENKYTDVINVLEYHSNIY